GAYIVPMSHFAIHREGMARFPSGPASRQRYIREWLAANSSFRRYVLQRLRRNGPLRSRDLEDRASVPWRTSGWNDGKNLSRMLELLWFRGEIAVVGRDRNERVWDVADRWLPTDAARLRPEEAARQLVERQLRALGVARIGRLGF